MNDRFERRSDVSYAWGGRKTYIHELEMLNINVPDQCSIFPFALQTLAANHYFGAIDRTGRALSKTKDEPEVEKKFSPSLETVRSDDLNRILFYFMFTHYIYNLGDTFHANQLIAGLKSSVNTFPFYMRKDIQSLRNADVLGR
jgi:hypothetical protein